MLSASYKHKVQEGGNAKACYEFGNDLVKMCFGQKSRMNIDYKIKDIKIV
jgi:hypothetical protein